MNPELVRAYRAAHYYIFVESQRVQITVDQCNSSLDKILQNNLCNTCAFITAFNPRSKVLTEAENKLRSDRLEALVIAEKLAYYRGYSTDQNGTWPREVSFLIFGISLGRANEIATQFQQNAFLWLQKGKAVELKLVESYHGIKSHI